MKSHSLVFNSVFNVIYKVLNILFPLVTAAYIARIIRSDLIGEITYAQNITQYFVLLSALGLPNYGTREIAKSRDRGKLTNKVFTELYILNAISTSCCLVVYGTLIITLPSFRSNLVLFLITGIHILLNYINVDWVYQGFEQYRYIAMRSFVVKLCSLGAILIFIRSSNDYLLYALISSLALAGNNVYNIIHLKKMGISFINHGVEVKRHLGPVISLLCTTIAIELYTLLDTTMIGFLCTKDNVAYYNYAMRITKSVIAVVAAIGGVLLPRLSYYKGQGNIEGCSSVIEKTLNVLVFLLIPSAVGISLCANEIVLVLYGSSFIPSILILMISSLLVVTLGFSNLFGTQILITFDRENQLLIATIIGAISNIIMNWFLIRNFQGVGAAIASVISETLVTVITFLFARRSIRVRTNVKNIVISLFASGIMVGLIIVLKSIISSTIILLVMEVAVGIIVYALITLLFKNSVAIEIMKRISMRIRRDNK